MGRADDFRKRAEGVGKALKKRAIRERPAMRGKQKALSDMADNEDWLDGKPPKRLTAEVCRQQAINCRHAAKDTMIGPHRVMLEHIADTWERIAGDIDKSNQ